MTAPATLTWNVEALRASMAPLLPGIEVEVAATLASTNSSLLDRLRGNDADDANDVTALRRRSVESRAFHRRAPDRAPRLLVAELQTAGRGRQGRAWHAAIGASLTFSLALPIARTDLSGLSLAVGVALAESLDVNAPRTLGRVGIKWPNDLWLVDRGDASNGRKLGGVLIETVSVAGQRWAVIGIGLNVRPIDAPGATTGVAALSEVMAEVMGGSINAPDVLARVALPLAEALATFEREGFAAFAARFAERDLLQGRRVTTTSPDVAGGIARGVDERGALRIETAQGLQAVFGGEVSVRPTDTTAPGTSRGEPSAC